MTDRESQILKTAYYQYQRQRRIFACGVFCLNGMFVIATAAQWFAVLIACSLRSFLVDLFWLGPMLLIFSMFFILLFIFCERFRHLTPLNWLIMIVIVECDVWGLARSVSEATIEQFGIAFGISVFLITIFNIIGAIINHDLTLDVVIMFLIAVVLFIGSLFFVLIHAMANVPYSMYIYCGLVAIIILMFIMYHSQIIRGGHYAEMRLNDSLLAVLIIYHDFVIFFLVFLYILLAASNNGIENLTPYTRWECNNTKDGTGYRSQMEISKAS